MGKKTTILNNGTGNIANSNSRNTLLGDYLKSVGSGQTIYGRYNDYTGDSSSDLVQFGAGTDEGDRVNAIRVKADGEVVLGGGGEVYMISPDTGDIIPVLMTGTYGQNTRIKKVYLSK